MRFLKSLLLAILFCPIVAFTQYPAGQSEVYIHMTPDNYPGETTWKLFIDHLLAASGASTIDTVCAETTACIRFEIHDSYGDGICCALGLGSYQVVFRGDAFATGGAFTNKAVHESVCIVDTLEIMTAFDQGPAHSRAQQNRLRPALPLLRIQPTVW